MKGKSGKGKKGKDGHTGASMVSVETPESMDTKDADCWYKQHKPQGHGKGKTKSEVTEISESDNSKQVEETWCPTSSSQPSSLSQVNNTITEIGCDDEGLDFLAGRQQETSTHCELARRKYVGDLRSG